MLIGISSAQGQGKSTVLSSLSEQGFHVIHSQTSRKILEEWGTTLADIDKDPEMRMNFQEEIFNRHLNLMKPYADSSKIYFVERTFADIFTYTVISLGLYNEYSDWLDSYYYQCKAAQNQFSAVCILSGLQNTEMDGVRSVNPHFTALIGNTIKYYVEDMLDNENILDLKESDHERRIEKILEYVSNFNAGRFSGEL